MTEHSRLLRAFLFVPPKKTDTRLTSISRTKQKGWELKGKPGNSYLNTGLEMVTLTEFANRMGVCPNTIRRWMKEGVIKEGIHYFHIGHIIRLPWSLESVQLLMKSLAPEPPPPRPRLLSRKGNRGHLKLSA